MNTSIVGHGSVRNGVVQTGAVALLLGAALAMGSAHAADGPPAEKTASDESVAAAKAREEAVERDAAMEIDRAAQEAVVAAQDNARSAAREVRETARAAARAEREKHEGLERTSEELRALDEKLRKAQERLQQAVEEVTALSQERARDAMGHMNWNGFNWAGSGPRPVIGIVIDNDEENPKDGARIEDVSPFGPAEIAGVRAGDRIVMVNGKDVKGKSSSDVVKELRATKVGVDNPVKLRVMRDGKPVDFSITPRVVAVVGPVPPAPPAPPAPPGSRAAPAVPAIPMPGWEDFGRKFSFSYGGRSELNGLEITPLTPQLGRYFGTEKGMLVLRAPKGELLKLQDGDVIVSLDGREPTSGSHITRILSSYQPGEKLTMRIVRDRKTQDIVVTFPERQRASVSKTRISWVSETDEE